MDPVPVIFDNLMDSFNSDAITQALEKAFSNSLRPVKALIVTNPHNPLGRCYSQDNLLAFTRFCGRHDIHFISDEVYALSTYGNDQTASATSSFVSALSLNLEDVECERSKVHVIWSMSKDLACSGLRLVGVFLRTLHDSKLTLILRRLLCLRTMAG